MNLLGITKALQAEESNGNTMTAELVERIDSHIRDLQTLRAWVIDSGIARSMALQELLGNRPPVQQELNLPPGDTPA